MPQPDAVVYLIGALKIVLIDVLLAGDNAVVIAMAVQSLPPAQRRTGAIAGAGGAIVLRIALTFFAARILELPFLKLAGGLFVFWIAMKLLSGSSGDHQARPAGSLRQAIWIILAADLTMSVDNILAVAAASKGNLFLLIAGLFLSISFVAFMSGFLAKLMARYPVVLWAGAAILGQVSGDMIATDPWVSSLLKRLPWSSHTMTADYVVWAIDAGMALLVLCLGLAINRKKRKKSDDAHV